MSVIYEQFVDFFNFSDEKLCKFIGKFIVICKAIKIFLDWFNARQ